MSGLTEQLKEILGRPGKDALSTLDLMALPSPVRRVINLMLRKVRISYPDLRQANEDLPEGKRVSQAELDEILAALCEIGWLEQEQQGETTFYKVSLKPKPGSVTPESPLDVLEGGKGIGGAPLPAPTAAPGADVAPPEPSGGTMRWLKKLLGGPKDQK